MGYWKICKYKMAKIQQSQTVLTQFKETQRMKRWSLDCLEEVIDVSVQD